MTVYYLMSRSDFCNSLDRIQDNSPTVSVPIRWEPNLDIIEDEKLDKSRKYGFDLPKGTWMISMKVNNDEVWNKVKAGEVKGFSIEGYFADKYEMSKSQEQKHILVEADLAYLPFEKCNDLTSLLVTDFTYMLS